MPAAIQAMPLAKLQLALTKSIGNLKARDRTIETLKKQLKATSQCSAELPTSSGAGVSAEVAAEELRAQLKAAKARAAAAEGQVATLVQASKLAGETSSAQIEELASEKQAFKQKAADLADVKVLSA